MSPLLTCQQVSKSYRARPLFQNLTIAVEEREKLGIIGPNGSGKSTLLKIMSGIVEPDQGSVVLKKGLRVCYLAQTDVFEGETVEAVLQHAIKPLGLDEHERDARVQIMMTTTNFAEPQQLVSSLSGGWRKRLSIASQLILEPDLLLLDEPTNHLDLEGVLWIESMLKSANFSFVVITHDRSFLENVTTRMVELNPCYAEGYLSVPGKYTDFLTARQEYLIAQNNLEQAMASKVRREIAWLQQGAQARETKAKGRIKDAAKLMDSFAEVKQRNAQNKSIDIDFNASGRKTKELLVGKELSKAFSERKLFSDLDLTLAPKVRIGLLGANGSGKTTLLRIIAGELQPDHGSIKRADQLKVVWFDQNREQLDQETSLWKALCPIGDSVFYRDRSIHVSTWAKRFLFSTDQLNLPISYLSGGEQARILIANLMLQPADILILDEPTNDLDIPSLEVLEESLTDFPGAIILVTHDRFMLNAVSNIVLALDGRGKAEYFADYAQWEDNYEEPVKAANRKAPKVAAARERRGLSTAEKRELSGMETKIEAAEKEVLSLKRKMEDPHISSNHVQLQEILKQVDEAQKKVDKLYERWHDLEILSQG
jgi:ABC transport system ATP-binding/permease protein